MYEYKYIKADLYNPIGATKGAIYYNNWTRKSHGMGELLKISVSMSPEMGDLLQI